MFPRLCRDNVEACTNYITLHARICPFNYKTQEGGACHSRRMRFQTLIILYNFITKCSTFIHRKTMTLIPFTYFSDSILLFNLVQYENLKIYLSTPPINEHRSALSTSGNISNRLSAKYTVVDLWKKKMLHVSLYGIMCLRHSLLEFYFLVCPGK